MSAAVCPVPEAHTPASCHAMYLAKKKEMPGLTPAAWRKAAAQAMGLDYDTYLALWKANKGAGKVAKLASAADPVPPKATNLSKNMIKKLLADANIQEQGYVKAKLTHTGQVYGGGDTFVPGWQKIMPTGPGKAQVVVTYGLDEAKIKSFANKIANEGWYVKVDIDNANISMSKSAIDGAQHKPPWLTEVEPASTPTVDAAASSSPTMGFVPDSAMVEFKSAWDDAEELMSDLEKQIKSGTLDASDIDDIVTDFISENKPKLSNDEVLFILNKKDDVKKLGTDFGELVDDLKWKPDVNEAPLTQFHQIQAAVELGKVSVDEAIGLLDEVAAGDQYGYALSSISKYKAQLSADIPTAVAEPVIDTWAGPLTHDLAQSVYKKMKKDMPAATPATLRHAAAEYLNVDYNSYLKAWKKPTTAAQKAKQVPGSKLPPNTKTPLSPTGVGKYKDKLLDADMLKEDLARAYGPNANKNYINLLHNAEDDSFSVQFPTSLLPTEASKQAVVKELEKLGLKVEKSTGGGGYYKISNHMSAAAKKKLAKGIKTSGTYKLPDGTLAWDSAKATEWSNAWWKTLTYTQKAAVEQYTGSGYHSMNGALRGGKEASSVIKELSSAMRPVDHEFTVFRGTDISIEQFAEGEMWSDAGFMSTAISKGSAWSGVKFDIVIPKGTKGAYVDPHSSHRGEMEFIIDKGTKFRVIAVDAQRRTVKMVAIPHK